MLVDWNCQLDWVERRLEDLLSIPSCKGGVSQSHADLKGSDRMNGLACGWAQNLRGL